MLKSALKSVIRVVLNTVLNGESGSPPVDDRFLLLEDSFFLTLEDGGKIQLEN